MEYEPEYGPFGVDGPIRKGDYTRKNTAANADAIRDYTDRALANLIKGRGELRQALELANNDYDGNAERLEEIAGALALLVSALIVEHNTWSGYARARAITNA